MILLLYTVENYDSNHKNITFSDIENEDEKTRMKKYRKKNIKRVTVNRNK